MSPHVSVPEAELPEVGGGLCLHKTGRIPSDDFGVRMQTYRVRGSDAGAREGHECPCSSLLYWMAARFGMETIVAEVRQRAGIAGVSPCCSHEFGRCRSDRAIEP